MFSYVLLRRSCISLSFSLKHPKEHMALRTSGSTAEAEGMT